MNLDRLDIGVIAFCLLAAIALFWDGFTIWMRERKFNRERQKRIQKELDHGSRD